MPTPPNMIAALPGEVLDDPWTEVAVSGNLINAGVGLEFDDAAAIRITSNVPFYYALADTDVNGATYSSANATRGWRDSGIWVFGYYAEERKLYVRAAGNGIISVERLKADSKVMS